MEYELREWRMSDAADLAAALNDRRILDNLRDGLPYPYTEKDAEKYITAMLAADKNEVFARAIAVSGRAAGSITAFRQENIHRRTAELGYYLAAEYWGCGIMSRAIGELCGEIFAATDILRIYAQPFSYNIGSRRALEKAGFTYEGTLKNSAVKNGRVQDMTMYSLTRNDGEYPVRRLSPEEIPAALELCWRVFLEFEAPEYPAEGVAAFRASLDDKERTRSLAFYGAYDGEKLVGTLCMRAPQHIGGFFVDGGYHRRGIGRRLFEAMRRDYEKQEFTVNSSPYAVEIYKRLGFVQEDTERLSPEGLRYTPMRFTESR